MASKILRRQGLSNLSKSKLTTQTCTSASSLSTGSVSLNSVITHAPPAAFQGRHVSAASWTRYIQISLIIHVLELVPQASIPPPISSANPAAAHALPVATRQPTALHARTPLTFCIRRVESAISNAPMASLQNSTQALVMIAMKTVRNALI